MEVELSKNQEKIAIDAWKNNETITLRMMQKVTNKNNNAKVEKAIKTIYTSCTLTVSNKQLNNFFYSSNR
jgi:hypothetical protein